MAKFMCLFRSNPEGYESLSPEQMQQIVQKWMTWKDTLEKNGRVVEFGGRLDWSGKVIRGKSKVVSDGPFVEAKDFVQGHMFVEAKDVDDAVVVAKGCPILDFDGSVEVRPFWMEAS
jgi:hypothetical protein